MRYYTDLPGLLCDGCMNSYRRDLTLWDRIYELCDDVKNEMWMVIKPVEFISTD